MSKANTIFEQLSYFHQNGFLVLGVDYSIVFNNGLSLEQIESITLAVKKLKNRHEQIISFSSNVTYKVSEVVIDETIHLMIVKMPPFYDKLQLDPFIQEIGAFFDIVNTDVVIMKDNEVVFRNERIRTLLGINNENALTDYRVFQTKKSLNEFELFLNSKTSGEMTLEILTEDNKVRLVKTGISYIEYNGHGYHISMVRDVSQIQEIADRYIAEIDYLRHSITAVNEGVIVLNSINRITVFNKAASELTGITSSLAYDKHITEIVHILDKDKKPIDYIDHCDYKNKDAFINRADGMLWNIAFSIDTFNNDNGDYLGKVLTIVDISEVKRREKEILYLSYHDVLTGLYNRTYLEETILRLDTPRQFPFSVIMGDVNGLKMTNDVFGHDEGDNLLRNVSKLLKQISRSEDIVGRWGGDEFVILLPKTSDEEAHMITKRIIRAFDEIDDSHNIKGIRPSISLGYGVKNTPDENIFEILKIAETNMYKRKMLSKESMYSSVISSMKTALYEKSHETEDHTNRLYNTCLSVAKHYDLTSDEFSDLELLCMLHDVGKIGIPDDVLKHPGSLSETQWVEMKKHSEIGYRIALATPELKTVATYILSHHEKFDGTGYPKGLKGETIPLLDRILGVADAFDAMIHDRIYRKALSKADAFQELKNCAGTQFDPEIVELFIQENDI